MGPRSDNRGYGGRRGRVEPGGEASMGPRSDNRGYGQPFLSCPPCPALQWVRGPITAVMEGNCGVRVQADHASMGPRSDNRGYAG
jgi:hypothetical protein